MGSINLAEFVTPEKRIDYHSLFEAVQIAVRGMNHVLMEGLPLHPLQEQRDSVDKWRQIGLIYYVNQNLVNSITQRCPNVGLTVSVK